VGCVQVMNGLKRALKIAHAAKQQLAASGRPGVPKVNSTIPLTLYVEILNQVSSSLAGENQLQLKTVMDGCLDTYPVIAAHLCEM
jgi:hypothetical protein